MSDVRRLIAITVWSRTRLTTAGNGLTSNSVANSRWSAAARLSPDVTRMDGPERAEPAGRSCSDIAIAMLTLPPRAGGVKGGAILAAAQLSPGPYLAARRFAAHARCWP